MMFSKNKKGVVWIPLLVIISAIVILIIIANFGSFTIFGKTYYIISPQLESQFKFWELLLLWIVVQVGFIYGYYKLFGISKHFFVDIKNRFHQIINYFRQIFK